jgi:hypothetical protein
MEGSVWVVSGERGQYSDYDMKPVAACASEATGRKLVERLDAQERAEWDAENPFTAEWEAAAKLGRRRYPDDEFGFDTGMGMVWTHRLDEVRWEDE